LVVFPNFERENIRYRCNQHEVRGQQVNYKSAEKYIGSDTLELLVLLPGGFAQEVHINIGHRFDLRFLRLFGADLSIKRSSSFFPPLIAATSQRGLAPRPAQVSPDGPRYFGGTFLPFNALRPPRTILRRPTTAIVLSIFSNCCSISARRSRSILSTRLRRSMSAPTVIRDRFAFGIVISGAKAVQSGMRLGTKASYLICTGVKPQAR
jgi:hypothetical protein